MRDCNCNIRNRGHFTINSRKENQIEKIKNCYVIETNVIIRVELNKILATE